MALWSSWARMRNGERVISTLSQNGYTTVMHDKIKNGKPKVERPQETLNIPLSATQKHIRNHICTQVSEIADNAILQKQSNKQRIRQARVSKSKPNHWKWWHISSRTPISNRKHTPNDIDYGMKFQHILKRIRCLRKLPGTFLLSLLSQLARPTFHVFAWILIHFELSTKQGYGKVGVCLTS